MVCVYVRMVCVWHVWYVCNVLVCRCTVYGVCVACEWCVYVRRARIVYVWCVMWVCVVCVCDVGVHGPCSVCVCDVCMWRMSVWCVR